MCVCVCKISCWPYLFNMRSPFVCTFSYIYVYIHAHIHIYMCFSLASALPLHPSAPIRLALAFVQHCVYVLWWTCVTCIRQASLANPFTRINTHIKHTYKATFCYTHIFVYANICHAYQYVAVASTHVHMFVFIVRLCCCCFNLKTAKRLDFCMRFACPAGHKIMVQYYWFDSKLRRVADYLGRWSVCKHTLQSFALPEFKIVWS